MNTPSLALVASLLLFALGCNHVEPAPAPDLTRATQVDAGCGRCMFGQKEDKKCNLAVRVQGKSYFVDGFTICQFGNPDLEGGMCNKVHQATVSGRITNGRFAASTFELIAAKSP